MIEGHRGVKTASPSFSLSLLKGRNLSKEREKEGESRRVEKSGVKEGGGGR